MPVILVCHHYGPHVGKGGIRQTLEFRVQKLLRHWTEMDLTNGG